MYYNYAMDDPKVQAARDRADMRRMTRRQNINGDASTDVESTEPSKEPDIPVYTNLGTSNDGDANAKKEKNEAKIEPSDANTKETHFCASVINNLFWCKQDVHHCPGCTKKNKEQNKDKKEEEHKEKGHK